jgi:hypothetical protein
VREKKEKKKEKKKMLGSSKQRRIRGKTQLVVCRMKIFVFPSFSQAWVAFVKKVMIF